MEVKHALEVMYQLESVGLQEVFDKATVKYLVKFLFRVGAVRLKVSKGSRMSGRRSPRGSRRTQRRRRRIKGNQVKEQTWR